MRDKVTEVVGASLPHMKAWLANPETWKNEPALAARAWLQAAEWAAPILSQAEAGRAYQDMIQGGAGAAVAAERIQQMRPIEPARSVEPAPDLARHQHEGIPLLEPGMAYLPKAPEMPQQPDPYAMPAVPAPPIDAQPVRKRECLPVELFDANGCVQGDDPGIAIAFRGMSHLNR